MKLITQTPKKALKTFLKQKPLRSEMDVFKTNLVALPLLEIPIYKPNDNEVNKIAALVEKIIL